MAGRRATLVAILGVILVACSAAAQPTQSEMVGPGPSAGAPSPTAMTPSPSIAPATPKPDGAAVPPSSDATFVMTPASCASLGVYDAVAGDTLWDIAQAFDTTVETLLAANPQIADRRLIRVGEKITISPVVLGTLGGTDSGAADINNRGQVVGWATTPTGFPHAFLWEEGAMTDLGTLGGDVSGGAAINDRGQVAGYSSIAPDDAETPRVFHAFLWEDGVMTDLGSLGGTGIGPADLNERGHVVGFADTASGETHAFVWEDGVMTDLGTLGGIESQAFGVNERGEVVGQSYTGSSTHAFLWQDGLMVDLGTFGWFGAWAIRINDQGQIALSVSEPSGASRAAVTDGGGVRLLGEPEGATRVAADLNNTGQVVGWDQIGLEGGNRAFAWQDGIATPLAAADDDTEAHAINDCGQVVGQSGAVWEGQAQAVLWTVAVRAR
jgi:probable HAF family extracellular repeat protein